jgi:ubiquitin carboxyl-terminal hydrolase 10
VSDEAEDIRAEEAPVIRPETPSTSQPQSEEAHSTNPTTPSSVKHVPVTPNGDTTPVAPKPAQKPAVPAVPLVAAIPKGAPRDYTNQSVDKAAEVDSLIASDQVDKQNQSNNTAEGDEVVVEDAPAPAPAPQAWAKPKHWAGLFNPSLPSANASKSEKGSTADPTASKVNTESLADALRSFSVSSNDSKIAFLKPRGLVNTGNMCYMNSVSDFYAKYKTRDTNYPQVLQVLVSCVPFYSFLDQVGKRAAHSFKSGTPLIDAM